MIDGAFGPVATAGALLLWGAMAGVDLVSFPQVLLSRPLVGGIVTGAIMGDPLVGTAVGALLELFALDVLAIGAAWYPDYAAASVAAAAAAAGWGGGAGAIALGVGLGLLLGQVGGWTLPRLRRWNARQVARAAGGLSAGDPATIGRLQWGGLARDLARSALLTAAGLAVVAVLPPLPPRLAGSSLPLLVVTWGGVFAAGTGFARGAEPRRRWVYLLAGVAAGTLVAALL